MLYLMLNLQADLKYKLTMFRLTCGRIDATKNYFDIGIFLLKVAIGLHISEI